MSETKTMPSNPENLETNGVVNGDGDEDKASYRPPDIDAVSKGFIGLENFLNTWCRFRM